MANSKITAGDSVVVEKATLFTVVPNCACRNLNTFRCHHCASVLFKFTP